MLLEYLAYRQSGYHVPMEQFLEGIYDASTLRQVGEVGVVGILDAHVGDAKHSDMEGKA